VGIGSDDLRTVKTRTRHVLGIDGEPNSSGDPSPATAWGVYHGIKAAVKHAYKADSLKGMAIALQGLGSVSYYLLEHLYADGAQVVGCDIDQTVIDRARNKYGIEVVHPDSIYDVKCDVFSPSALGAAISVRSATPPKSRRLPFVTKIMWMSSSTRMRERAWSSAMVALAVMSGPTLMKLVRMMLPTVFSG
jgi:glutamate dehydrogenase/leucine dehydrogenase